MDFHNYKTIINKHGVEIITTKRYDKPYYLLTYNAGSDNIYKVNTDDLKGIEPEDITADNVLELIEKGH